MKQKISQINENVSRWMLLFTFCFVVLVSAGIYKNLSVSVEKVWSGWMGNAWKSAGEAVRLEENGQILIQEFQAARSLYLDAMKIRILLPETDMIAVGEERDGKRLLEIEATLYSSDKGLIVKKTFDLAGYSSGDFLVLPVHQKTSTGRSYRLEMCLKMGSALKSAGYYIAFVRNTKEVPEMHCTVDGAPAEGNIAIAFRYHKTKRNAFYMLLLKIAGFFVLQILLLSCLRTWLTGDNRDPVRRIVGLVFWIATPAISFYLTQEIIGINHITLKKYLIAGLMIYYLAMCAVTVMFRKIRISSCIYMCLMILLPVTNYFVYQFRGRPVAITDLHAIWTAAEVAGQYTFGLSDKMGHYLLLFWTYLLGMFYCQTLEFPKSGKVHVVRAGCFAVSAAGLFAICTRYIDKTWISAGDYWRLNETYDQKGMLVMLAAQVDFIKVDMPDGYSLESMQAVVDDLRETMANSPAEEDKKLKANITVPENVIVIMNESFSDLETLGEIHTDTEILPFLHSMNENTTKGQLHIPVFGGGTSNTEYEFLTGHSTLFFPGDSIIYELFCGDPEYGMAIQMKKHGYRTVAIHPSAPSNWNREKVYKEMGFDDFIHIKNWDTEYEMIRCYMSDRAAYDKLIALTEGKRKEEKLFAFCVTMQNHGGYSKEDIELFEQPVTLMYDQEYPQAETYLSLIHESDKAFQELISYYSDIKEPTMIVMFGDHQASIEEDFYSEVFGKDLGSMTMEEFQQRYVTPYVIWTNYKRESREMDMSSNYFGSYVLQEAGIELSLYNRFLLMLQEKIPVIGKNAIYTAEGEWYLPENLPEPYLGKMDIYKRLQYNIVFDREHTVLELVS